jgi:hypothetical protein
MKGNNILTDRALRRGGNGVSARKSTPALIHPSLEEYLPDMSANYRILISDLA